MDYVKIFFLDYTNVSSARINLMLDMTQIWQTALYLYPLSPYRRSLQLITVTRLRKVLLETTAPLQRQEKYPWQEVLTHLPVITR